MKQLLSCLLISICGLSQVAHSHTTRFSPYADITLNTYWDSKYNAMEPADLSAISAISGVKNFSLAFITDAGSCQAAWGGQSSYAIADAWGRHMTDKMLASGIDFTISLGGANGNDLSKMCSENQLTSAYEHIIKTYQPKGLDFDIENGTAIVPKVVKALQNIQNVHPDIKLSFTLPVMPEGLTAEGKNIVKQAHDANLHFAVNIMAMDYGPAYPNDMGAYAIQAATNLHDFLQSLYPQKADADVWNMVEVTPMIGVNDVNVEQFTLKNVDTLRQFANQNHIGALSMWSITRDKPCADKWASPICSGNNLQSVPYEFSKRFLG